MKPETGLLSKNCNACNNKSSERIYPDDHVVSSDPMTSSDVILVSQPGSPGQIPSASDQRQTNRADCPVLSNDGTSAEQSCSFHERNAGIPSLTKNPFLTVQDISNPAASDGQEPMVTDTPSTSEGMTSVAEGKAHTTSHTSVVRSSQKRPTSVGKSPRDFTRPENVKHLTKKSQETAIRLSYMTRSVVKRMREEAFNRGELQWATDEGGKRRRLPDELSTSSEESAKSDSSNEADAASFDNYDPTDYRPTPSMVITSTEDRTPSERFGFHCVNQPRKYTSVGKQPRDFTRKRNMRHLKISNEAKSELQCVTRAMLAKRKQCENDGEVKDSQCGERIV